MAWGRQKTLLHMSPFQSKRCTAYKQMDCPHLLSIWWGLQIQSVYSITCESICHKYGFQTSPLKIMFPKGISVPAISTSSKSLHCLKGLLGLSGGRLHSLAVLYSCTLHPFQPRGKCKEILQGLGLVFFERLVEKRLCVRKRMQAEAKDKARTDHMQEERLIMRKDQRFPPHKTRAVNVIFLKSHLSLPTVA